MSGKEGIISKGYLNEAFRVFHNTDILGACTPVHFHSFYKVTFVKYGKGRYMIDGRTYDIQSGDIILVGINVPHQPFFEEGELYDRYTLYISAQLLESFDVTGCYISGVFSSGSALVVRPDEKSLERMTRMLERIETEKQSSEFGAPVAAALGVIWFLIEVARCREESSREVPFSSADEEDMLKVFRFINENLKEELSAEKIASHFNTDKKALEETFIETFACPLDEYVRNRRLARAREMIMQGTAPAESCYESGYKSMPDFSEDYRKKYGCVPKCPDREKENYEALSDFFPD
ncbi:MAG: helix-turn-helix domain-containing protein [Lachnospiraceae bacterium]|nr:helix-turn-helix domain-containing protein [Lachnospiraceae bacterium]